MRVPTAQGDQARLPYAQPGSATERVWPRWRARPASLRLLLMSVVLALFIGLLAGAGPAWAVEGYETLRECIEAGTAEPLGARPPPTCSSNAEGLLVPTSAEPRTGSSPAFGGFLMFALLWALVPLVIAARLASARRESVAMAVVLTLLLGWIGLAIVYFGQKRTHEAVGGLADRAAAAPSQRDEGDGVPAPPPASREERLRELDRLLQQDLITAEEYDSHRRTILDGLSS